MRSVLTEGDWEALKRKYGPKEGNEKLEPKLDDKIKSTKTKSPKTQSDPQAPTLDGLLSTIAKFIPAEAVAIFLGTFALLKGAMATTPVDLITFIMFFVCLAIAIGLSFYKASTEKVNVPGHGLVKIPNTFIKTAIPTFAFVVWAINLEGFLVVIKGWFPLYDPVIGGIVLLVYTGLIPVLYVLYSGKQPT